jgi:hypothetical protein
MQTLSKVIAAVQREVLAAIAENKPSPAGVAFEAGRVVLSLGLTLRQRNDGGVDAYVAGPGEQPQHSVRIEFSVRSNPSTSTSIPGQGVVNALMEVFGVPGFDSSARATVFRETVATLSDEQIRALMTALVGGLSEQDAALKSPRQMVLRLLEKGPAGVERSTAVLAEIFRGHPVAFVLRVIEDNWKTPEAWAG